MENKKDSFLDYAMYYGLILGVFWAFKYLFLAEQEAWRLAIYIYYILNAGSFLLIYIFYFRYRMSRGLDNLPSRMRCLGFVIVMCLFASIVECAGMFIHFQFINPAYFESHFAAPLRAVIEASFATPQGELIDPAVKEAFSNFFLSKLTPLVSNVIASLFLGGFIGSLLALLDNRKNIIK